MFITLEPFFTYFPFNFEQLSILIDEFVDCRCSYFMSLSLYINYKIFQLEFQLISSSIRMDAKDYQKESHQQSGYPLPFIKTQQNEQYQQTRQITYTLDANQIIKTLSAQQSEQQKLQKKHSPQKQTKNTCQNEQQSTSSDQDICNFTYSEISFNIDEVEEPRRKKMQPYTHKKPINPNRKTRTTITEEKIQKLNRIFKVYDFFKEKNQDGTNKNNKFDNIQIQKLTDEELLLKTFDLKEAARYLGLSYSAVVHKYQEYKEKNQVACGVRVLSKYQKRKYEKTTKLQELLYQILKEKSFYTAMQISKYILEKYDLFFSRAKINRTLLNLGFSLGMRSTKQKRSINIAETIDIRFRYAAFYKSLAQNQANFVYLDQHTFLANNFVNQKFSKTPEIILTTEKKQFDKIYVSLMAAINQENILYWDVKRGFFNSQEFQTNVSLLADRHRALQPETQQSNAVLVTDINGIHINHLLGQTSREKKKMSRYFRRIYLPPYSSQLNPVLRLFEQLQKKLHGKNQIKNIDELVEALKQETQKISQKSINNCFCEFQQWIQKALSRSKF